MGDFLYLRVMNKFYIYLHIRKTDNIIFYVGKGTGDRAWDKYKRNQYWCNTVNKHGYEVQILCNDLTEEDAYVIEKNLILFYGRKDKGLGPLVNLQDGGEGGDCKTNEEFINESTTFYGGVYGYEKTQYTNSSSKVIVTCYKHGDFTVTPNKHLNGRGCPKCGNETKSRKLKGIKRDNIETYKKGAQKRLETNQGKEQLLDARKKMISIYGVKISVNGEVYNSIGEASRSLSISDTTLRRRLKSKNFVDYQYV